MLIGVGGHAAWQSPLYGEAVKNNWMVKMKDALCLDLSAMQSLGKSIKVDNIPKNHLYSYYILAI